MPKNPGGRPSKFDHIDMKHVRKLAESGWTDKQMSDFFEVSEVTWNAWKKKSGKFLKSLRGWKESADNKVVRSLYERACGYSHPEDKIFNDSGTELIVNTTKHYPPDATSMIFWLKNRLPKKWRDKQDIEMSGHLKHAEMSDDDLKADTAKLIKDLGLGKEGE